MNEESQIKLDLLKHEMDSVQNNLRAYGQIQFTIKGWAITLFSGFIYFAVKEQQPIFLGLCALTVVLFWLLDAIFKSIQTVYIDRARKIEAFLQHLDFSQDLHLHFQNFPIPNTEAAFDAMQGKRWGKAVFHASLTPQLALLYIVMLILLLVLAVSPT